MSLTVVYETANGSEMPTRGYDVKPAIKAKVPDAIRDLRKQRHFRLVLCDRCDKPVGELAGEEAGTEASFHCLRTGCGEWTPRQSAAKRDVRCTRLDDAPGDECGQHLAKVTLRDGGAVIVRCLKCKTWNSYTDYQYHREPRFER
jgi:hypothetical protein